jgi:putative addiction module component (TIGR02574 family)
MLFWILSSQRQNFKVFYDKNCIMSTQHIQLNVPLSFNQLIDIVRQLSPQEKLQLSGILWDETEENEIDISEEHKQIVRQRLKRMDEQPESCLTWEDIERKIKL